MSWLKRDRWKAGIALAGVLLLLELMVWVPVSAAGAYEGALGLATPVTGAVQATPTVDATVTTFNKEKLAQEVQQLKNQNDRSITAWFWNSSGLLGPVVAALFAVFGVLWTAKVAHDKNLADSRAERKARKKEQQRWLKDQEVEREKRAEERFQKAVEGLGSEREEAKVGAAITLRTFLRPGYEQFYTQTFDLAVANLRLPRTSQSPEDPDGIPHPPEDPNTPLPPTTLSQALITVFQESFPRARKWLKKQSSQFNPQFLDASRIQLDGAHLADADLKEGWMQNASLRTANLEGAKLSGAHLEVAKLSGAFLSGGFLEGAHLEGAILLEAHLEGAHLEGVHLELADLSGAHLEGADLRNADPEAAASLRNTKMSGVTGLTQKQREACIDMGAIFESLDQPAAPLSPLP